MQVKGLVDLDHVPCFFFSFFPQIIWGHLLFFNKFLVRALGCTNHACVTLKATVTVFSIFLNQMICGWMVKIVIKPKWNGIIISRSPLQKYLNISSTSVDVHTVTGDIFLLWVLLLIHYKGALCSFGEEIQTQNFNSHSINEEIIQMYVYFFTELLVLLLQRHHWFRVIQEY